MSPPEHIWRGAHFPEEVFMRLPVRYIQRLSNIFGVNDEGSGIIEVECIAQDAFCTAVSKALDDHIWSNR